MQLKGRELDIVSGNTDLPYDKVMKYRAIYASEGFDLPEIVPHRAVRAATNQRRPGTVLQESLWFIAQIKPEKANCTCATLAAEMDIDGIAKCRLRRDSYYIPKMLTNKHAISEAMKAERGWKGVLGLAAGMIPDDAMIWWLRGKFDAACNACEKKKTNPNRRVKHVTVQQKQWFRDAIANPPTIAEPFTDQPVLHFGAHLWPRPGRWQWHVEKWNQLASQFNGRMIVCVATDSETDTAKTVRAALNPRFEVVELPNTKEGENPSFRLLQTLIPTGPDDVFFYCHGKGMKDATWESQAVRIWCDVMYETVIANPAKVIEKLAAGYRAFGSFRAFGRYPLKPKYNWHYAGTFFAMRAKYMNDAKVVPGYGGVEAWPGAWCPANLAWCEFADNRSITAQYDYETMSGEILAELEKWRNNGR